MCIAHNEIQEIGPFLNLLSNGHLKSLNLSFNKIGDNGMVLLCSALQHTTLKYLNVACNGITAITHFHYITTSPLLSLDLSGNKLSDSSLPSIQKLLPRTSLVWIDLSRNYINPPRKDWIILNKNKVPVKIQNFYRVWTSEEIKEQENGLEEILWPEEKLKRKRGLGGEEKDHPATKKICVNHELYDDENTMTEGKGYYPNGNIPYSTTPFDNRELNNNDEISD